MLFDDKLAAAKEFLASKGLRRAAYAPTVVASLWRLGVRIPPPHFAGFFGTFTFAGGLFGAVWGVVMWFAWWSRHGTRPTSALVISSLVGLIVGLVVAVYYRVDARTHSIPKWDAFAPAKSSTPLGTR